MSSYGLMHIRRLMILVLVCVSGLHTNIAAIHTGDTGARNNFYSCIFFKHAIVKVTNIDF